MLDTVGPSVIVLTVNGIGTTSVVPRKPPSALSLTDVMNHSSMTSPFLTKFEIVGFLSIMLTNMSEKLVLATRIKHRWRISSSQKLVGDGEPLCQMFSRSRIIILERLQQSNANFLQAILKCCSINDVDISDVNGHYETFRGAVKQIQSDPKLVRLRQTITSIITNYYQCPNCQRISDSLSFEYNGVSIYLQSAKNSELTATTVVWDPDTLKRECPHCSMNLGDMILDPLKQTHQHCPAVLMLPVQKTSRQQIQHLRLSLLNHATKVAHSYAFCSILLVDQYNSVSLVLCTTLDHWTVYCEAPYLASTPMPETEIDDLFVTAQYGIVFLEKVS